MPSRSWRFAPLPARKYQDVLGGVHDLERLIARVALGRAGPRDLVGLQLSLSVVPRLLAVANDLTAPLLRSVLASLDDLADVCACIETTLVSEPAALVREGGYVRDGCDAEIDELRSISRECEATYRRDGVARTHPDRHFVAQD